MTDTVKWFGGLNALLGVWLIVLSFAVGVGGGLDFWNYVLVGAGILGLSGYNAWTSHEDDHGNTWAAVGSVVLGAWLVVTPFVFGLTYGFLFWNDIVVGMIVAAMAALDAYDSRVVESDPSAAGG